MCIYLSFSSLNGNWFHLWIRKTKEKHIVFAWTYYVAWEFHLNHVNSYSPLYNLDSLHVVMPCWRSYWNGCVLSPWSVFSVIILFQPCFSVNKYFVYSYCAEDITYQCWHTHVFFGWTVLHKQIRVTVSRVYIVLHMLILVFALYVILWRYNYLFHLQIF